jgi:hypothetical protein
MRGSASATHFISLTLKTISSSIGQKPTNLIIYLFSFSFSSSKFINFPFKIPEEKATISAAFLSACHCVTVGS